MINDIIVIDDCISTNYQDAIQQRVMGKDFPWYFSPSMTYDIDWDKNIPDDAFGFSHQFYNYKKIKEGKVTSTIAEFVFPLAYEACSKIGFTSKEFYFGRFFQTFPSTRDYLAKHRHTHWHVDMPEPHLVCLYYVNDADGKTVFTSHTSEDVGLTEINKLSSVPITQEVAPKKGRCVLFDGKYYHATHTPNVGRRVIANFDIG
jgi:hypothetical protein